LTHQPPAEFFRVSTEEASVTTASAAPKVAPRTVHHSHTHLVFPNLLDTFR